MKLLFIADIVGQPGRRAVKELLPELRRRHSVDVVVANGENAAGGSGITVKAADGLRPMTGGLVVVITSSPEAGFVTGQG